LSLNKQIHIYTVDTSSFYNEEEMTIHKNMNELYRCKTELYNIINKLKKDEQQTSESEVVEISDYITSINRTIKYYKDGLYLVFEKHQGIRTLNPDSLNDKSVISIFDSVLTRTMKIPENTLSKDIIIVQTYFFDVIEDIILDGFIYEGNRYLCLTASAGQIRTKKTVFIKEDIWLKHQHTLMCGLTIDKINELGGVNINKYLAYLALCNSATDEWKEFDITKSIVVDDMETNVKGLVDFIDDETYKIARKEMDINITHTDGCGMILLLVPFSYDIFIKNANINDKNKDYGKITDIYGQEHDIIKEGIQVIFTKSQFKMWKYFNNVLGENGNIVKYGWEVYKDNYKQYNCQAGKCNEEEDDFSDAKINYQMLQTLTDMTDEELKEISKTTKHHVVNIGSDRKTMLKVLGVKKSNQNKNNLQQALEIYPELLNDTYCKEILKQVKKSLVKEGRSAKLSIKAKYTFIVPDLYAFCEYMILGDKDPKGLLEDGEVYCNLYPESEKLDCLRSPHLFLEHSVRKNIIDDKKKEWFITKGLYTSCHDLISKILQFDVDGDKSLVCAEKIVIEVADRNMKDIVPLYYNMRKAGAEIINNQTIFNGLKTAYTGGNIGMISNDITKIWNSENVNLDVIKLLCMENNFTIDYAKTLYKPKRPNEQKKLINGYTKSKTPHFFIYAKDKDKNKVEKINNSVVNRLNKIIPNPNIKFNAIGLGTFDYKMLMKDDNIKLDSGIIKKYKELDLKKHFIISKVDEDKSNMKFLYQEIRREILELNSDIHYVVDVLVKYLYEYKKSNYKTTLWECFGDMLVINLRRNVEVNKIYCEVCGDLINQSNNKTKYCPDCAKEIEKENWVKRKRKQRNKDNVTK